MRHGRLRINLCLLTACLALLTVSNANAEWAKRGDLSFQTQIFTDNSQSTATHTFNASVAGSAEFNRTIGENGFLTISPFFRIDQHDEERTHVDLREFIYNHSFGNWELSVGLGKVFWGVAESTNLVDIINQKDAVEGLNPEHKLGQPMINLLFLKDWGEISLFVLPGFRERTFVGDDGRPRGLLAVDTDNAEYESGAEQAHIDFAGRVSGTINEWDLGAHVFHGTARNPILSFPSLVPFYFQVTQVGLDVQATLDSWLLKSEIVYRSADFIDDHVESINGFEYSFYSVADSNLDIGVVTEWLYDDRGNPIDNIFQNDLLVGLRFALNDEQSTEALIGIISDLENGGDVITVEASRRIGDRFKFTLDAYVWSDAANDPILGQLSQEDYVQLEFGYFF